MSRETVHHYRAFGDVEFQLFVDRTDASEALWEKVDAFTTEFPSSLSASRLERLGAWITALPARPNKIEARRYFEEYGCAGVRRFLTRGKRRIYQIPIETFPNNINNVYLILDGHGDLSIKTLIDVGTMLPQSRQALERGFRVTREIWGENVTLEALDNIILTHGHIDHFGDIFERRRRSGAKVFVHELDARIITNFQEVCVMAARNLGIYMRRAGLPPELRKKFGEMYLSSKEWFKSAPVDRVVGDDELIINGYRVIHTPGHCPGHICIQVDNVLFSGDHVIQRITPHQAPESITHFMGLQHYLDSLRKLLKIPGIDLILAGHETPITNPYERLHEIIASHHERLEAIRRFTEESSRSIFEITKQLFPTQRDYGELLALEEAGAHVEYLSQRGELAIANLTEVMESEESVYRYVLNQPSQPRGA